MLRFTIGDLILFCIPIAFGAIWFLDEWNSKPIIWAEFSVEKLETAISNNKTALVLGLPNTTRGFNEQAFAKFNHPSIRRAFNSGELIVMKCEYQPFTSDHGLKDKEMAWLTQQVNGSYKEIVLVRVCPSQPIAFERMFFSTDDVLDLLSLKSASKNKFSIYAFFTVAALGFVLARIVFRKEQE